MIPALMNTEYLPTDAVPLDSALPIVGFVLAGLIVIAAFTYMSFADDPLIAVLFIFIAMMVAVVPFGISVNHSSAQNQENLAKNVKTAYDIDTIIFDEKVSYPKSETLNVTITYGGKASKVILSEDQETFEPSLASFESTLDVGKLKRNSTER